MMLTETVLNFGGSAYPQIDPGWFGDPLRSITRLPGQLMGLSDLSGCEEPPRPQMVVMSDPNCSGFDASCRALQSEVSDYNLAVAKNANNAFLQAVCKYQNCLNQGAPGYPRDCGALYPVVPNPPLPINPGSTGVLKINGNVSGYSNQPIGTYNNSGSVVAATGGTGANISSVSTAPDETSAAKKLYIDLITQNGAANNSSVMALFNRDFDTGVEWYKSGHGGSTKGLVDYISPKVYDIVQGWLKTAGVLKADGTVNNTNTGGGSGGGSGGGTGGNADSDKKREEDKKKEPPTTGGDSQSGMFIVLGAVALLMLAGKGR